MRTIRSNERSLAERLLTLLLPAFAFAAAAHAQLGTASFRLLTEDPDPDSHDGSALAVGDFNGDGVDDLVTGRPGSGSGMGSVSLYISHPNGPGTGTRIYPDQLGQPNESGSRFGAALATGDFDGNGFDDLAIGSPGKIIEGDDNAGYVVVLYANEGNFDFANPQIFSQGNLAGAVEAGDQFGFSLAAGDLSADGIDDLVVGVPTEDVLSAGFGQRTDAGAVNVIYGIEGVGLTTSGNEIVHQEVAGVTLNVNDHDLFGFSLAIGDFTGDLQPDLAVGVPGEFRGASDGAGAVEIFEGAPGGLDLFAEEQVFSQLDASTPGTPNDDDQFGYSLASGDFDGNGRLDLAVGVPGEGEFEGATAAGIVQVFYGFPSGLSTNESDLLEEWVGGTTGGGIVENFDRFGETLTSGNFDPGDEADLAVGAPLDNSHHLPNSGEVNVFYGSSSGLGVDGSGVAIFNFGHFGSAAAGDEFSAALVSGRFDGDPGGDDLVVGIPNREVDGDVGAGIVLVIRNVAVFADGFESGDASQWSALVP